MLVNDKSSSVIVYLLLQTATTEKVLYLKEERI